MDPLDVHAQYCPVTRFDAGARVDPGHALRHRGGDDLALFGAGRELVPQLELFPDPGRVDGEVDLLLAAEHLDVCGAELRVDSAPDAECALAVRVPGWAGEVAVSVNGQRLDAGPDAHGYLVIRRCWRPGDVLIWSTDIRPRLTYPDRRIDAVRGTAAVERGPLVYCFEQADQPDGTSVEDLALDQPAALSERAGTLPGIGPTVTIEAAAQRLRPTSHRGIPFFPEPDVATAGSPVAAVAIPYFQWDNRDGRAMRVWLPLTGPAGPATTEHPAAGRDAPPTDIE